MSHYVTEGSPWTWRPFTGAPRYILPTRWCPCCRRPLSNGICSLNPQVDRLALSCIMTMDGHGAMLGHKLAKTVIRSTERMTYEDCNLLLEDQSPELAARYAHILPMLRDMAGWPGPWRRSAGPAGPWIWRAGSAISSAMPMVCPWISGCGNPARPNGSSSPLCLPPTSAWPSISKRAALPAVYRVHEKPLGGQGGQPEGHARSPGLCPPRGRQWQPPEGPGRRAGTPQAPAIHTMVLRSLMKARYDVQNLGHFGLAAKYYCHFTSPIRRYPDLMVHRILTALLDGTLGRAGPPGALRRRPARRRAVL